MLIGKTLLSRYKITQKLGSGGFGDTYLAIDIALPARPPCVVKNLKPKDPNPAAFPIAKNLFDREAEYLYRLGEHDQIPRLYAHFEEGGEFYLVEEFVDGDDLSQEIIPGNPLSSEQTVKLLQEILEVLAFVHQHNVIHRDIKPPNIIRRKQDGKLVLIDFGAVKEISALTVNSQGQTSLTVGIGSPGYMPSEQAKGKPKLASDVYAVGMIGIQALTGVKPDQLEEDPNTGEITWGNWTQVSNRLANVLTKMVRDHFKERYQNASEALEALVSTSVSSGTSPGLKKPAKLSHWAVLVGLAVAAIAGGVLINRFSSPPPSPVDSSSPAPPSTVDSSSTNITRKVYDVTFSSPTHTVDSPPSFGASSSTPSRLLFGQPTVKSSLGVLNDQPLVFHDPLNPPYNQIEFKLGHQADNYSVSFDLLFLDNEGGFTIFFDTPTIQSLSFKPNQQISIFQPKIDGKAIKKSIGTYSLGTVLKVQIDVDLILNEWSISVDNVLLYKGEFFAFSGDVMSIRFSHGQFDRSTDGLVGIDNILITKDKPMDKL
ncbi:MAG: protein kinase [Xenococcaceae cyanobacterium]